MTPKRLETKANDLSDPIPFSQKKKVKKKKEHDTVEQYFKNYA